MKLKEFIKKLKERVHAQPESYLEDLNDFDKLLDDLAKGKYD